MKGKNRRQNKPASRIKVTPANVIGVLLGAGIAGIGLYGGIVHDDYSGYFFAVSGLLVITMVLLISRFKS